MKKSRLRIPLVAIPALFISLAAVCAAESSATSIIGSTVTRVAVDKPAVADSRAANFVRELGTYPSL